LKTLEDFTVDEEIDGKVVGFAPFGVFVDVGYERNGMIHISEIADQYVNGPEDFFSINEDIKCKVKFIDHEKNQIKLTTKYRIN